MKPIIYQFWLILALPCLVAGCALFPDTRRRDVVHNPFPQLKRVAILPFYNQSSTPTVDTEQVAEAYYAALQAVPGFEVLPVGVTKLQWMQYSRLYGEPLDGPAFQQFAQFLGVEAVVVGSVTDYDVYYPPRLAMTVHWYAANPGFHPIPAGYGLPWGTKGEKQIPQRIVREAEFELARSQLATQTPMPPTGSVSPTPNGDVNSASARQANHEELAFLPPVVQHEDWTSDGSTQSTGEEMLPQDWPDPTDLIPDGPSPQRPAFVANHDPVLTHTRLYRGDDAYFTERLADYVETNDDARPLGWKGYLSRSDDFVRFCCHLHIVEMLESRGGRDQSDLILQWPLSRY